MDEGVVYRFRFHLYTEPTPEPTGKGPLVVLKLTQVEINAVNLREFETIDAMMARLRMIFEQDEQIVSEK